MKYVHTLSCAAIAAGILAAQPAVGALIWQDTSTAKITYDYGLGAIDVSATGQPWQNPNILAFTTFGNHTPAGHAPAWNNVSTAVTHSVGQLQDGSTAVAINIPQNSHFFQFNPQGQAGLPAVKVTIDFTVDLKAENAAGMLSSLPGAYALQYNLPGDSTGKFTAEVKYLNENNVEILATQEMNTGNLNGNGIQFLNFAGSANPVNVAQGDSVKVTGSLVWEWHHLPGAGLGWSLGDEFVGMEFTAVPAPGALGILVLAGLTAMRRRRA